MYEMRALIFTQREKDTDCLNLKFYKYCTFDLEATDEFVDEFEDYKFLRACKTLIEALKPFWFSADNIYIIPFNVGFYSTRGK